MELKPFHEELAILWQKQKKTALTIAETKDLRDCMDLHVAYMFDQSKLFNLSLAASMADDVSWQHEICARIDKP